MANHGCSQLLWNVLRFWGVEQMDDNLAISKLSAYYLVKDLCLEVSSPKWLCFLLWSISLLHQTAFQDFVPVILIYDSFFCHFSSHLCFHRLILILNHFLRNHEFFAKPLFLDQGNSNLFLFLKSNFDQIRIMIWFHATFVLN